MSAVAGRGRMAGRVAVVTGSTSGIGRRVVERFAAEGAAVVVTGRRAQLGEEVTAKIRAQGGVADFYGADLRDPGESSQLVARVLDRHGRLDTLVNNAGDPGAVRASDGPLHRTTPEVWAGSFASSLQTTLGVTSAALPHLAASGRGRVVNISSAFALRGGGYDVYSTMKAALVGLTRSMAVSYASTGIRVNCLAVGYVVVERSESLWEDPATTAHWSQVGLTRPGRPDDVAEPCLWLGSDESEYVTGVVIPIDGGMDVNGVPGAGTAEPVC